MSIRNCRSFLLGNVQFIISCLILMLCLLALNSSAQCTCATTGAAVKFSESEIYYWGDTSCGGPSTRPDKVPKITTCCGSATLYASGSGCLIAGGLAVADVTFDPGGTGVDVETMTEFGITYYNVSNPKNSGTIKITATVCGVSSTAILEVDLPEPCEGCPGPGGAGGGGGSGTPCSSGKCFGSGGGAPGSGSASSGGCADFRLFLGAASMFNDGGYLSIHADVPSTQLATPFDLTLPFLRTGVEVYTNSGLIQQVKTPLILVNVISNTPYQYQLQVFAEANVTGTNVPYGTNGGAPFVTWTVKNPDTNSAYNRLWITEQRPGATDRQFQFTYTNSSTQVQRWDLLEPDGTTISSKWYEPNATNTAITNIVWQTTSGGNLLKYTVSTVKAVPVVNGMPSDGRLILSTFEGSGSVTQFASCSYYPSNAITGSANRIQRIDSPDGRWEYHIYDSVGRMVTNYSAYCNNAPPSGTNQPNPTVDLCKETDYTYDDGSADPFKPTMTVVQVPAYSAGSWQMVEVSRSYSSTSTGYAESEQCSLPGAGSGTAGNLITATWTYDGSDPASYYRLKAISNPDGTARFYTYSLTISNFTTIESVGEPDDWFGPSSIIDGTQTTTVIDYLGRVQSRTTADIVTGTILSQDVYTYDTSDPLGLSYSVVDLANRTNTVNYACCGLESTVDPDGVQTIYYYNALKQNVEIATVRGSSVITVSNVYDGLGRMLVQSRIGSDNSVITLSQSQFDVLGRVIAKTNALNGKITHAYDVVSGQQCFTNIYPDGGTRIEIYNRDGRLRSVSGTAAFPLQYLYGAEQDDGTWREYAIETKLSSGGGTNEWTKTYVDGVGRNYKTIYSAASGSPASVSTYDTSIPGGQLIQKTDPDGNNILYAYDNIGNRAVTALDIDANETIDYSGLDRITMVTNDVTVDHGVNVRRTRTFVWPTNSVDAAVLVSSTETSTNGLTTWQTIWNTVTSVTSQRTIVYGPSGYRYETNTAPDGSFAVYVYQYGQLISTTKYDSTPSQLTQTTYGYDAHGRQNTMTDSRNGTTTYSFNNADQVSSLATPIPATGQSAQTTVSYFDSMSRNTGQLLPDGTTTTNLYYPNSLLALTYGSRTYPVGYSYDAQGRMKTMTNWSGYPSTGARVTTWNYDSYRGFLTGKTYDGSVSGPSYTFTAGGRLATRVWARGITTTYNYDGAGILTNIAYSDGVTSSVTNIVDRLGRVIQVGASNQVCQYQYDLAGDLLVETNTAGLLAGLAVTNGYDQYLRRTNLTMRASGILSQTAYSYTNDSRLWAVSDGTNNATYSYLANSPLVSQITFKSNSVTAMTTTKQYDYLNRLTLISNAPSASAAVSFNYSYNAANQRAQDTLVDGSYWVYQYDTLGQVTSGKKYWRDGTPVAGQQFEYTFDDIGNRTQTKSGGDQTGAFLRPANYTNNTLNQITGRDVPSYVDVMGIALATNTVTVNGLTNTYRKGEYFRTELSVSNTNSAVWTNLWVDSPGQTSVTGNRFVAKTAEAFYYDADGNLTNDGGWIYTWDAENRLVKMAVNTGVGPQYQLLFVYDARSRRIQKLVSTNGVPIYTNRFLYDGWNLLGELNPANAMIRNYVWGSDVSGNMKDAGGVGGLLEVCYRGSVTTNCFVAFDGNGNIVALANANDASDIGNYEYGPFGEVIRATGPMAKLNPFRFSTKYDNDETDLLYYGFRYYNPSTGRWLSRDPLGDVVFLMEQSKGKTRQIQQQLAIQANLPGYVFVLNDPEDRSDYLGLAISSIDASVEACMKLPTPAAQQACLTDLFDTLGLPKECCALAAAVQIAKRAVGAVGGCKSGDSCATLSAKSATWLSLALARTRLNTKCFSGGDPGHQQALADAWANIGNCVAIQIKNGCAGPY